MKEGKKCKRRDKGQGKDAGLLFMLAVVGSFFRISKTCMYDKGSLPSPAYGPLQSPHPTQLGLPPHSFTDKLSGSSKAQLKDIRYMQERGKREKPV